MEPTMKTGELKKQLKELHNKQVFESAQNNSTRARSITIGTCFGGTTEISMRGDGNVSLWVMVQPAEVTELIHQLAANIGCHINIQPRNDFGSWRKWNDQELPMLGGTQSAPFGLKPASTNMTKELQHEPSMATEKTVKRRSTKRAATST